MNNIYRKIQETRNYFCPHAGDFCHFCHTNEISVISDPPTGCALSSNYLFNSDYFYLPGLVLEVIKIVSDISSRFCPFINISFVHFSQKFHKQLILLVRNFSVLFVFINLLVNGKKIDFFKLTTYNKAILQKLSFAVEHKLQVYLFRYFFFFQISEENKYFMQKKIAENSKQNCLFIFRYKSKSGTIYGESSYNYNIKPNQLYGQFKVTLYKYMY